MQMLITIALWILMGGIASHYAKDRGRNPKAWFGIGLMLGILGIILLFILPKLEVKPVVEAKTPEPQLPPDREKNIAHKFWYYLDPENKQFGPMSFYGLEDALKEGKISLRTYVWNEDLANWKEFGEFVSSPSE
jgi:hypothetical protein